MLRFCVHIVSKCSGRGEDLLVAVGRRYFEEAKQLADHSMLLSAVDEVGLDRSAAQRILSGNDFRNEVMTHYRWAVEDMGINSPQRV